MDSFIDYYQVLGIPPDADEDAVKKAFRMLAKQYHPDLNKSGGANVRFIEINKAYETLIDPEQRRVFDGERTEHERPSQASESPQTDETAWKEFAQAAHGHTIYDLNEEFLENFTLKDAIDTFSPQEDAYLRMRTMQAHIRKRESAHNSRRTFLVLLLILVAIGGVIAFSTYSSSLRPVSVETPIVTDMQQASTGTGIQFTLTLNGQRGYVLAMFYNNGRHIDTQQLDTKNLRSGPQQILSNAPTNGTDVRVNLYWCPNYDCLQEKLLESVSFPA